MMNKFRIIPVIDIMNGIAVHANKGLRNEYQPIHMKFSQSSKPQDLMNVFSNKFQFSEIYIADLDSIIHEKPNTDLLRELIQSSTLKIMLDAGIRNLYDVMAFKNLGLAKIILATETIDSFDIIDDAISEIGLDKIIVSVDMKKKKLISESEEISKMEIDTLLGKICDRGIKEIILLDLAKIGSMSGGSDLNYQSLRSRYPQLQIILGGGIKDVHDIQLLHRQGFNGALIATALHKGVITPQNVIDFRKSN